MQAPDEDFDFDPEDADICDSLDDFLEQASSSTSSPVPGSKGHETHLEWDLVSPKTSSQDGTQSVEEYMKFPPQCKTVQALLDISLD